MAGEPDPNTPPDGGGAPPPDQGGAKPDPAPPKGDPKPDPEPKHGEQKPQSVQVEVPEKFLTDGKPDLSKLVTSYKALETAQFKKRDDVRKELQAELAAERAKSIPATAAEYVSPEIKAPDGREVKLPDDLPLMQWFRTVCHDKGVTQKEFEKLASDFIKLDLARGPDWTKESQALGERADDRLERCNAWAQRMLPPDLYDAFAGIPATASVVKMFEHIMELSGEAKFALDESGAVADGPITKEQLKAMQRDPLYWSKKDPVHIAKVRAGFARLAGNKQADGRPRRTS